MADVIVVDGVEIVVVSDTEQQVIEVAEQGPPGPRGPMGPAGGSAVTKTAGVALGGNRMTLLNADDEAIYASADQIGHANLVYGMTAGAATEATEVDLIRAGELEEVSWNWTPGLPVYLGLNGVPTQTLPPEAVFSLVIGFPITPTKLVISIREPIILS